VKPPVWATAGPVQAEIFVLRLREATPELAGPCGPAPWYLEHALRRLAWLVNDDEVVHSTLSDAWLSVLAAYRPEPFRHLG
jgi:hypothetical protein